MQADQLVHTGASRRPLASGGSHACWTSQRKRGDLSAPDGLHCSLDPPQHLETHMRPISMRLHALMVLSAHVAVAQANELVSQVLDHGYKAVGEFKGGATEDANRVPRPTQVYAKIIEPKKKVALLSINETKTSPQARYSVATLQVNCGDRGVKYEAVQSLNAEWNPTSDRLPLPKTVWHKPAAGSPAGSALGLACQ